MTDHRNMWDPPDYVPPPPPKRPTRRRPLVIGTVAGVLGIGAIAALTEPEDIRSVQLIYGPDGGIEQAMQLGWIPPSPIFLVKMWWVTRRARRREATRPRHE